MSEGVKFISTSSAISVGLAITLISAAFGFGTTFMKVSAVDEKVDTVDDKISAQNIEISAVRDDMAEMAAVLNQLVGRTSGNLSYVPFEAETQPLPPYTPEAEVPTSQAPESSLPESSPNPPPEQEPGGNSDADIEIDFPLVDDDFIADISEVTNAVPEILNQFFN